MRRGYPISVESTARVALCSLLLGLLSLSSLSAQVAADTPANELHTAKSSKEVNNPIKKVESRKGDDKKTEDKKSMAGKIGMNDQIPDLTLPDQSGKMVSLKDFQGKKVVVVYFYPKDQTSICTAEACSFRDSYDSFKELGAEVIGVSSDSVKSHQQFAEKHHLQFSLLADTSGMARKAFGVPNAAMVLPGRVTYVIDKNGVVRYIFNSMLDGSKHVTEALRIVKELSADKPAG